MKRLFVTALALTPSAALAHPGHGAGFVAGLTHPLGGADHVLAMLAVGLLAATLQGRAVWALPLAFIASLIFGAGLGRLGVALPGTEPAILASVVMLGAAVAAARALPLGAMLLGVVLFGVAHGYAHGVEAPTQGVAAYGAGFVLASTALHLAGLVLGRTGAVRALGTGTMVAGLVLIGGMA